MSLLPENDRGRPVQEAAPMVVDDDSLSVPLDRSHCWRCGHLLTAEASRRRGLGPVCRRLVGDAA